MTSKQRKSQQRARIILQVRSGVLTAREGARHLGISRKTYYQWEKRALGAMLRALEEKPPGRPHKASVDPQRAALQKKIRELEAQLEIAQHTAKVRSILMEMQRPKERDKERGRSKAAIKKKKRT